VRGAEEEDDSSGATPATTNRAVGWAGFGVGLADNKERKGDQMS
jgi:hypothetical protein